MRMPRTKREPHSYKTVSVKEELVNRVERLIRRVGTYHSVAEFVSEAVRWRLEDLERNYRAGEDAESRGS
jgi:Arc/MetJ-type ribon-helix-helix transcriptional regulator